jgi:AAA15 family ATPase/GTPase
MKVLLGLYTPLSSLLKDNHQIDHKKIINFLKYADIHITDIKIDEHESLYLGYKIYDNEKVIETRFLSENIVSEGTKKLLSYSLPVLNALKDGIPIFIDEFDNSLHPLIIEAIIKLFNSPITNPKNAQLIISCHAVNIMTNKLFRRDQIWFCEKDQYGATDLYSLVEYKEPVRKDASYNKNYLHGKYGAVPYIVEGAMP